MLFILSADNIIMNIALAELDKPFCTNWEISKKGNFMRFTFQSFFSIWKEKYDFNASDRKKLIFSKHSRLKSSNFHFIFICEESLLPQSTSWPKCLRPVKTTIEEKNFTWITPLQNDRSGGERIFKLKLSATVKARF